MTLTVPEATRRAGFARLAHFTPSRNLDDIIRDEMIRSSKDLADNAPESFSPTDRERFDGHPDKLCCSFEFPNGYYLAEARKKPEYTNHPDWVCLLLDPELVFREGTLFSPCNAARGSGAYLASGGEALMACFSPTSGEWARGEQHHPRAPTDLQAEVLIPAPVELSHLRAIVVPSDDNARLEHGRLRLLGLDPSRYPWMVAPLFFARDGLSTAIRYGREIEERAWTPEPGEQQL